MVSCWFGVGLNHRLVRARACPRRKRWVGAKGRPSGQHSCLMERGWRSGPRLPVAPSPEPNREPCDRDPRHAGGIRFELWRYGRRQGVIRLCGPCFLSLNETPPPDPLHVEEAA